MVQGIWIEHAQLGIGPSHESSRWDGDRCIGSKEQIILVPSKYGLSTRTKPDPVQDNIFNTKSIAFGITIMV